MPEADFVGSALLKESVNSSIGDDDKIYFFFTEKNQEQMPYSSQTRVARVARVCRVRGSTHRSFTFSSARLISVSRSQTRPHYHYHFLK